MLSHILLRFGDTPFPEAVGSASLALQSPASHPLMHPAIFPILPLGMPTACKKDKLLQISASYTGRSPNSGPFGEASSASPAAGRWIHGSGVCALLSRTSRLGVHETLLASLPRTIVTLGTGCASHTSGRSQLLTASRPSTRQESQSGFSISIRRIGAGTRRAVPEPSSKCCFHLNPGSRSRA